MFNVGPLELMVLVVLALIVFGPAKLPELMASAGHALREFQRASRELTEVFQETQAEFSSALDLESTATTVTEPAAEPSANGHATTEVASTVPFVPDVPATTAPAEYETAAAMVDPVEPFPEAPRPVEPLAEGPRTPEPAPAAAVSEPASELGTAAGLVDDAPPAFEVRFGPNEPAAGQPAAVEPAPAAKARRPRRPKTQPTGQASAGVDVAELAAAPPADAVGPLAPEALAPSIAPGPESGLAATAPLEGFVDTAEPVNGATTSRRRAPRSRAVAEPAAPTSDESA